MNRESQKFGRGGRELGGAVDLINHYKLWAHHDFFCKKPLPMSVSDSHYLHNVVGDTEIRKGEGMELDQLFLNTLYSRETNAVLRPFELGILNEAFHLRETKTPVKLHSEDKGVSTVKGKLKSESKEKEKKRDRDKDHKKHKHRHKGRNNGNQGDKIRNGQETNKKRRRTERENFLTRRH